ncbi:uncharacterized protein MELLADRAFT_109310 [Melampsora larici-populina 98AG31]|uniref:Uncharacterized protein n=1 Tax=Melampsora larici-populina (strain 98AG31 / pathotype 3-4-7) TaxID=747676 RepID=F4RW22_MELLP|nr:uncharacterized protein MELLADRAFT_109310 [Melampsora larici-populina 98AG31]EGG03460.1 hypothetical protein MELLADRAFT_109310 [Melampsora larici-populina 98AG31]
MLHSSIWTDYRRMRRHPPARDSMAMIYFMKHTRTMSSVTSERLARSRTQTSNPGMIPQSPHLRRRTLIKSIIQTKLQSNKRKNKWANSVTLNTSDEEKLEIGGRQAEEIKAEAAIKTNPESEDQDPEHDLQDLDTSPEVVAELDDEGEWDLADAEDEACPELTIEENEVQPTHRREANHVDFILRKLYFVFLMHYGFGRVAVAVTCVAVCLQKAANAAVNARSVALRSCATGI